jgi:SWI/SNF-related matrix-associated actin-dependent regulator of chromatin subfamily A member 5
MRSDNAGLDILITTYESYVAEEAWFKSRRWSYCVLDEGHKIKNSETNIAHKLQGIGSLFRLGHSFLLPLPMNADKC